ncbi:MAG TPA: histidine kinase, partial [Anaerolineae bacterium]
MRPNMLSNSESLPYVLLEGQVAWPMPIALELEEKARQWPVSLTVQPTRMTLPGLVLALENYNRLVKSEEKLRQNQQQLESLNKNLEEVVAERTEQVRRLASEVLITEQKVQQAVSQLLHDELQQILFSIQMQMEAVHQILPAGEQVLQDRMQELREATDLAFAITR